MPAAPKPVIQVILEAFTKSKGKTVDLVVEHDELIGITPEMYQWWGSSINDSERYRMWCPEDHISFSWEVPPSKAGSTGAIQMAEEKIGEFPASVLRIRREDQDSLGIPRKYTTYRVSAFLGPDNITVAWVSHEFESGANGMKMLSTFRFPAKVPAQFLKAMHKHCRTEMGHLPEFLPKLYRERYV